MAGIASGGAKPELNAPTTEDVRRQLERILQSPSFTRSKQITNFLTFIVEATLDGNSENLKGYVIAVDVLGRRESFDPKLSTIVRSEARRLREKLTAYYRDEGENDQIEIDLPKGSYVPNFEFRGAEERVVEAGRLFAGYRILEELKKAAVFPTPQLPMNARRAPLNFCFSLGKRPRSQSQIRLYISIVGRSPRLLKSNS